METIDTEFSTFLQLSASLQPNHSYEPSTWVQLQSTPTDYSADQALLLCKCDYGYWVAWVPEFGEIFLHVSEFSPLEVA
jgi:hypothetical protein